MTRFLIALVVAVFAILLLLCSRPSDPPADDEGQP